MDTPKYKRVLLKISGEALAGDKKTGFDEATCIGVAKQVKELVDDGIQVAIVTGGGNFWRGRSSGKMDRSRADQMGMLATIINFRLSQKKCFIGTDALIAKIATASFLLKKQVLISSSLHYLQQASGQRLALITAKTSLAML